MHNIDSWERYAVQNTKMSVFTNDIICSRNNGTIHKLIIIRILLNKTKMKMRSKESSVRTTHNGVYNVMRHRHIGNPFYNFLVLIQNLIADAKHVLPFTKRLPGRTIRTMLGKHLHQAIRIQNYQLHHCL